MGLRKTACFIFLFSLPAFPATIPTSTPSLDQPLAPIRIFVPSADFTHQVGVGVPDHWELDYKRDKPGYALFNLKEPLLLPPGTYRVTFVIRRGKYPKKGLLYNTYGIFRLELWDATTQEKFNERELQVADFSRPNNYEERRMDFSMTGREGHAVEPRVYWIGLANAGIKSVLITRFPDVSLKELENKALRLGQQLESNHLENGFVVSRWPDGSPDELGDAATFTGFYLASLAWKYGVTKDVLTYQMLENTIHILHNAIQGTPEAPLIARFVAKDGTPEAKAPSKDVYTSFFFGYSAAYPFVESELLKEQMRADVETLATKFLKDGLAIRGAPGTLASLTPYFTEEEIRHGIQELFLDKHATNELIKNLKRANRVLPFGELWPGFKSVVRALKKRDEDDLARQVLPTLNGIAALGKRVRDILREQYREDLFPKRFRNQDYPGKKLEQLLTVTIAKFPKEKNDDHFKNLDDLKILASNALIDLHIIRTAAVITKNSQFEDFYRTNLYAQEALLQTALDWHDAEENFRILVGGNPSADKARKGYLSPLSLMNLISLETNPAVRENYRLILDRWWKFMRNEDNPLAAALILGFSNDKKADRGVLLHELDEYPEDRTGFGPRFWDKEGSAVAERWGGGQIGGFSREPLPVSRRPKDSFLWQRNVRRLRGDDVKIYPATDYLFVYWLSRFTGLIPPTPKEPNASVPPTLPLPRRGRE